MTINSYLDYGTTYQTDDPIKISVMLSDDQPILGAEVVAIVALGLGDKRCEYDEFVGLGEFGPRTL